MSTGERRTNGLLLRTPGRRTRRLGWAGWAVEAEGGPAGVEAAVEDAAEGLATGGAVRTGAGVGAGGAVPWSSAISAGTLAARLAVVSSRPHRTRTFCATGLLMETTAAFAE